MSSGVRKGEASEPTLEAELSLICVELASRAWRRLRSRNLAIVALAFLGALVIAGLVLPQPDRVGPIAYGEWRQANPTVAQVAAFVGLDRLFSTWWFLSLAAALYLNTLACAVTQVKSAVKRLLAQPEFPSPRFLSSARCSFQVEVDQEPAAAAEAILAALRERGYSVKSLVVGNNPPVETQHEVETQHAASLQQERLYAEKGNLGILGSPVLHLGLLVVLTAVAWSGLTRFTGYVEVGEGQGFKETKGAYLQQSAGLLFGDGHRGFDVRVDRVEVGPPIAFGRVSSVNARSAVTILKDGAEVASGTLEVNRSLEYRGVRLHQTSLFGPAVVVSLDFGDGRVDQGIVNLAPAGGTRFKNSLYLPGTIYRVTLEVDTADNSVQLQLRRRSDTLFSGQIRPDQQVKFDGLSLAVVDLRHWTGLRVVSDRSEPLLYAGFFVTLIGLAISALVARRQIWALIQSDGDGTRIACAGVAAKARAMFAEEFSEIKIDSQRAKV